MGAGRPTAYNIAFCDTVIEYGELGKSRAWIAATLGVSRQTLHNWEDAHPEFLDAMTRARDLSQKWWEDAGQEGMTADKFNSSVWSRSMGARFPDDWREVSRQEQTGKDGAPIQTEAVSPRPTLTREEWEQRYGLAR